MRSAATVCSPSRRELLLGACALAFGHGCAIDARRKSSIEPAAVLKESAQAHGIDAFPKIHDINVAYDGRWHSLVKRLQPKLIDPGFRGASEERLLPQMRRVAQFYSGPSGHKSVNRVRGIRDHGELNLWFNGQAADDWEQCAAAALVADGYSLFLLGPLLLEAQWRENCEVLPDRHDMMRLRQDGTDRWCHCVSLSLTPGLGWASQDQLRLFIDAEEFLLRRVSFSLNGLESTRGAVAHVDMLAHSTHWGIRWPIRFHEHLERPFPLGVHDWQLSGLDVNRGYTVENILGAELQSDAAAPARRVFSHVPATLQSDD